jgi:hypothetical protein
MEGNHLSGNRPYEGGRDKLRCCIWKVAARFREGQVGQSDGQRGDRR